MSVYLSEFMGTFILVLFGLGVIANVKLKKTTGNNGGVIAITAGFAFGLAIPIFIFGNVSGAHFNPAITIALALVGKFEWAMVLGYIVAQFIGAFLGAAVVLAVYYNHFKETNEATINGGVFCTAPQIKGMVTSFITEFVGTFLLMFGILGISDTQLAGGIKAIAIGILFWAIGLSIGGPTGFAVNPARDLGPRLALQILPVPGKGKVDWKYALIPLLAPIIGAIVGAYLYVYVFK